MKRNLIIMTTLASLFLFGFVQNKNEAQHKVTTEFRLLGNDSIKVPEPHESKHVIHINDSSFADSTYLEKDSL